MKIANCRTDVRTCFVYPIKLIEKRGKVKLDRQQTRESRANAKIPVKLLFIAVYVLFQYNLE